MNEYKKLAYKLEDTFALGKSLPIVAMRQLTKIAEEFTNLQEDDCYKPKTHIMMASHINDFVSKHKHLMDDERELKKVFTSACKHERYGPKFLELFERDFWESLYRGVK